MEFEDLDKNELIIKIKKLEAENAKLKSRNSKKRPKIKTSIDDIVKYWTKRQDECGLSVDWSEANERCWCCGYRKNLQKCHIIPDSIGGKDEPSNLVLLCARCHINAPNVDSKTFMWDWIRANGTPFYDTYFNIKAYKEYEFIYKKSFFEELRERDIISPRDYKSFFSIPEAKSANHFAHPWKNDSTYAGLLRIRLEEYDKRHPNIKKKSDTYRQKEKEFNKVVCIICGIAEKYNWNVWEGSTKNPFSITINTFIDIDKKKSISIKLGKDNVYKACYTNEINPNNNKVSDYVINIGKKCEEVEAFILEQVNQFFLENGMTDKQDYVFTIDPIYHLRDNT